MSDDYTLRKVSPEMSLLTALLLDALDDLERSLAGLATADAERIIPGSSSLSCTIGHVAQHLDSWVNDALAGHPQNSCLASEFRRDGTGKSADWETVRLALSEVIGKARSFLAQASEVSLSRSSLYAGSVGALQGKFVTGNYRLGRLIAHIYYHIGEITTVRAGMGHQVVDFPSVLPTLLRTDGKP